MQRPDRLERLEDHQIQRFMHDVRFVPLHVFVSYIFTFLI